MKIKEVLSNRKGAISGPMRQMYGPLPGWIWLLMALAALIVLGVVNVDKIRSNAQLFSATGSFGGTVVSLDQVDFIQNDPSVPSKQSWQALVTMGVGADKLEGIVDADELNAKAGVDKADRDFKVEFDLNKEQCVYAIKGTGNRVDNVKYHEAKPGFIPPWRSLDEVCLEKAKENNLISDATHLEYTYGMVGSGWFKGRCVFNAYTPMAYEGRIGLRGTAFDAAITVTNADGDSEETSLGYTIGEALEKGQATTARTGKLGNIGQVTWTGNLVTGDVCPDPDGQDITAAYDTSAATSFWKTVVDSRFTAPGIMVFKDDRPLGEEESVWVNPSATGGLPTGFMTQTQADVYNKRVRESLAENDLTSQIGGVDIVDQDVETSSADAGTVIVELGQPIQRPQFLLKIDAAWVGIKRPAGIPKLTSLGQECFPTGESGRLNVQVENVGQDEDAFEVSAICEDPIRIASGSTIVQTPKMDPGDTKTLWFPLTGETAQDKAESLCTITAVSQGDAQNTDTLDAQACVTKFEETVCVPNAKVCTGDIIRTCNKFGTKYTDADVDCSLKGDGLTCDPKTLACVKKGKDGGGDGGGWFDNLIGWLRGLFPFLGPAGLRTLAFVLVLLGVGVILFVAFKGKFGIEGLLVLLAVFFAWLFTKSFFIAIVVGIILLALFWRLKKQKEVKEVKQVWVPK